MKTGGRINIPSITLDPNDLKALINILLPAIEKNYKDLIAEKLKSKVIFGGENFKEEYLPSELPDFRDFRDGLEGIYLSMEIENEFELSIT